MSNDDLNFTDPHMLRIKAEEQLLEKNAIKGVPESETDIKKLTHELQVHQIELEMQNEELTIAYETAEEALRKFTMLYDLAPIGYFILDVEGTIHDLNFTGAEMLGDRRFSLINSNFKLFVTEKSLSDFNNFFTKVFVSNAKESCNVLLGYYNNPLCQVYMEGIVTGEDRKCLLSLVDVERFK